MGELIENSFHFNEELVGHLPRETVADKDALDDEISTVGRHGVGRDQPASLAQAIGKIIEGEA